MGSPNGAAAGKRAMDCSRGIAHRRCLGRGGGGLQPWDRPQAPQKKGERWSAAVKSPTGAPGGEWRVGGQPWDGPLALSRRGGV